MRMTTCFFARAPLLAIRIIGRDRCVWLIALYLVYDWKGAVDAK